MGRIQDNKRKMGTYKINKISLSLFDEKGFLLNYGIHTITYFHKEFEKQILADNHKKRDSKRFSQKERIFKDDQRFTQIKKSVHE